MQRSGGYFKKAAEIVQSGRLGEVTFCHTWQTGAPNKKGFGRPADGPVPAGLDWDMWLGPAPKVPFNLNRWGVGVQTFPTFRYFWDYAGGAMTDWGVHLIDPIHQCYGEAMPTAISAMGGKLYVDDNRDTPDTMMATFHYPKFLLTYESRTANPMPMFGQGAATSIHGSEATLVVRRGGCYVIPNQGSAGGATYENDSAMNDMNMPHWKNFIDCIKTRARPTSDIETCVRSSTVCVLANLSMRHKTWLDWDETNWTVRQSAIKPYLKAKYRAPWKLEV
jgi:predicted dehydrogenase